MVYVISARPYSPWKRLLNSPVESDLGIYRHKTQVTHRIWDSLLFFIPYEGKLAEAGQLKTAITPIIVTMIMCGLWNIPFHTQGFAAGAATGAVLLLIVW